MATRRRRNNEIINYNDDSDDKLLTKQKSGKMVVEESTHDVPEPGVSELAKVVANFENIEENNNDLDATLEMLTTFDHIETGVSEPNWVSF